MNDTAKGSATRHAITGAVAAAIAAYAAKKGFPVPADAAAEISTWLVGGAIAASAAVASALGAIFRRFVTP